MMRSATRLWPLSALALAGSLVLCTLGAGQRGLPRGPEGQRPLDRNGVPQWETTRGFESDVFTFARVKYDSYGRGWRGEQWRTDFPDSDLNFSFRLQQLTSMKVNPQPVIVELDDPELIDYPFLYMIEPGNMAALREEEITNLRRYCLNGGFLMVDDFWGEDEWFGFYRQIKRVFPDREPIELPLEHEIFHCVYELEEKPQIPSINMAMRGRESGITWERWDAQEPHYRAIFDDQGKIIVLICHNTDLGDGWEREGLDPWYFREFSEKKAYPLGINIVTYAMTH